MSEPGRRGHSRGLIRLAVGALSLAVFVAVGCRSFEFGFPLAPRLDPRADLVSGPQSVAPTKFTHRAAQYIFFSDFDLKQEKGLLDDLGQLRDRVSKTLQLPLSNATIQVYVFDDQDRYKAYLDKYQGKLPARRALFVRQQRGIRPLEDLLIYTYRTDRLAQDLRHESTHALLNSVIREVPLWLDEGLAEYFELPADRLGVNADHLRLLRNGAASFKPDLARLESLKNVQDMMLAEYREAWAWVHLMLHGKPEGRQALLAYVAQLRDGKSPGPLGPRLAEIYPDPNAALLQHLERLDAELAKATANR